MQSKLWRILLLLPSFSALAAEPFVIHEWGTFTSFQQSQGYGLYGLQRGDEPLPNFVYLRNPNFSEPSNSTRGCRRNSYSCDWAPTYLPEPVAEYRLGVNQRMETPVIYFHSDIARDVKVTVDFPQGLITEWFPKATSFEPAIGQVETISGGTMTWDVKVHTEALALPPVPADSIWLPSRQVKANDISVGTENERLIFYRGVGDFQTSFQVGNDANGFGLENRDEANLIPAVIYLHVTKHGGFARHLGTLSGSKKVSYDQTSRAPLLSRKEYLETASHLVYKSLVLAGLYKDEALAMVNTWKHAYFETPGERFLYILPRPWTDNLLPMTLAPAPDALERVLVGRVEVMNHYDAVMMARGLVKAAQSGPIFTDGMGPFAEQHLALAQGLLPDLETADSQGSTGEELAGWKAYYRRAAQAIEAAIVEIQNR